MLKAWEELVLKWFNCFDIGSLETIKDIKKVNFLPDLSPESIQGDHEPFQQLLTYLKNEYPSYHPSLKDSRHKCWNRDRELYILSSLLLLHASIYQPCEVLQKNAKERMLASEQELMVAFLQKAMVHEQQLTKEVLIDCIPSAEVKINQSLSPMSSSPVPGDRRRRSGTPLAEFLSSPVARQKRRSGMARERLSTLEDELEQEQAEKIEMQEKIRVQEAKIADLARKYKEKISEVESVKEDLKRAEEGQIVLNEEKGDQQAVKRKLHQELTNAEKYIEKLEEELSTLQISSTSLQSKLTISERRTNEIEAFMSASKLEYASLKEQLGLYSEENKELKLTCSQLQRDLNQIQSTMLLSPKRPNFDSPSKIPTLSPGPESLGFIVEKEMIDKENENYELKRDLKILSDELKNLKKAYKDMEETAQKDNESALRIQRKLETKLASMQSSCDLQSKELNAINTEKEGLSSQLADLMREKGLLHTQLDDLISAKTALSAEQKALTDAKHTLAVKVAQLDAKLLISEERERELYDLSQKRMSELNDSKVKIDDMEVKWKKALKDQKMIEEELGDALKKINLVKSIEREKNDLEDKMITLVQINEDLDKQLETEKKSNKNLERRLQALTEEKKTVEFQLQDVRCKRDSLVSSLQEITVEKEIVTSERVALMKEKVCWEVELEKAQQKKMEAKEDLTRVEAEKKSIQDKLVEVMAKNDQLTSDLSILMQQENDTSHSLAEMSKQKKAIDNQLSAVMKEKEKLKVALEEYSTELEKSTLDRESLHQKLADKNAEFENIASRLSDLKSGQVNLEAQLVSEKNENKEIAMQLTEVKHKLELTQSEVCKLNCELEASQKLCEEKCSYITNLEAEKADLEDDLCHYGRQLSDSIQENLSLKNEVSALKEEKNKLSAEHQLLTKQKLDLERKFTLLESSMSAHVASEETLHIQLAEASQEKHDLSLQLKDCRETASNLEVELNNLRTTCETQECQLKTQKSQMESMRQEQEKVGEDFASQLKDLHDECNAKSQQLSILKNDLIEMQTSVEKSKEEKEMLKDEIQVLSNKNCLLEAAVTKHLSQTEELSNQCLDNVKKLAKVQGEKQDALDWVETVESDKKALLVKLQSEHMLKEELLSQLQTKEELLSQLQTSGATNDEIVIECREKLSKFAEDLKTAIFEKESISLSLESMAAEKSQIEGRFQEVEVDLSHKIESLQEEVAEALSKKDLLAQEISRNAVTITEANTKINSLEEDIATRTHTIQDLERRIANNNAEAERRLRCISEANNATLNQWKETQECFKQLQLSNKLQEDLLLKAKEENNSLCSQIEELQGSIEVKEELLSETQQCVEKLRSERDSLRELLTVKDKIITCHKATESSLERQSSDELDVAMKLLEGELKSSKSTSEIIADELKRVQENFEEEKINLQKALEEAQSTAKSYQQEAVALKQQLLTPRGGGKLAELQEEEKMWQLDRVKHQLEFQFDLMMTQKVDVEEHLNQLREIIKDVSRICDILFAALPTNCDAVHEVTVMKKEVETKLRAVDKKYADSLCCIISLAHEMFMFRKKQNEMAQGKIGFNSLEPQLTSEREDIEVKVSKSCEVMTSLTCDVRAAMNSCKFLIERCESYLKAQTRESLKIKVIEDSVPENCSQNSQSSESKLFLSSDTIDQKNTANFTDDFKNCSEDKNDWFGGSSTVEEGYFLLKKSHVELEKKVSDLQSQLIELQTSIPLQKEQSTDLKVAKLQEKINALMLRPTQEQLDEKLRELHTQYSNKLESMKAKMKHIVKDEVDKVEEEKIKLEKEIITKYSKRITEYEEHVQQLSTQLWKLGEKLLQEQQDHRSAKERLAALKERQRQYMMTMQRTQSLDRLDMVLQGPNKMNPVAQLKGRRCNSQTAHSGLASTKVHPVNDDTVDVVDESMSRRSTMMAPASMGLAFPEEDEDGEVFNNDYLAELKEGKCRVPLDGTRLSELQYRNSLCPPHLKSSYPLETQFHDPQICKDEEIKGADRRLSRQGKDKGTTSYKRPGPPTPSKKAGRLSLQGKEDLTPRIAALREHNESQSSQGSGMLRVAKTTPSRLKALFTSSKVANVATLPALKKDESSNPATPTSKRLSIFKRRFGSNKENQNSHYSSLH